jgi:hypothetical protein
MERKQLDWTTVDAEAETLGVPEPTRRKWRQRRVPYPMQLRIMENLAKRDVIVTASDFDALLSQQAAA